MFSFLTCLQILRLWFKLGFWNIYLQVWSNTCILWHFLKFLLHQLLTFEPQEFLVLKADFEEPSLKGLGVTFKASRWWDSIDQPSARVFGCWCDVFRGWNGVFGVMGMYYCTFWQNNFQVSVLVWHTSLQVFRSALPYSNCNMLTKKRATSQYEAQD